MSDTMTIDQLRDSLEETIKQVQASREPVRVVCNGDTAALLVPPDAHIFCDPTITREEAEEIARGIAISEADIAAGRVVPLEEVRERLRHKLESEGEDA